jgi:hypothetical protein
VGRSGERGGERRVGEEKRAGKRKQRCLLADPFLSNPVSNEDAAYYLRHLATITPIDSDQLHTALYPSR